MADRKKGLICTCAAIPSDGIKDCIFHGSVVGTFRMVYTVRVREIKVVWLFARIYFSA